MWTTRLRSGPARAAAALASGALALGLAAAPSAGADGADGGASGDAPRRFAQVVDPRGDTRRVPDTPLVPGADRRLADLTKVRYRMPTTTGGDLRIVSRWNLLRDGSEPGARRQVLRTSVQTGIARDVIDVRVNNVTDRVRISYPTAPGSAPAPEPERVEIDRTFGAGGRMDVVLSTEWLGDRDQVFLYSNAYSGGLYDSTERTDDLDVGPTD